MHHVLSRFTAAVALLFPLSIIATAFAPRAATAQASCPPVAVAKGTSATSGTIDTTLARIVDVTNDGSPDSVAIRLLAPSMDGPFCWVLEVHSADRLLFTHHSDDSWLNTLFGTPGFDAHEGDPRAAKRAYYFVGLLEATVTFARFTPPNSMLNRDQSNSINAMLSQQLRERGVTDVAVIGAAVDSVEVQLQRGTYILIPQASPVKAGPPTIYVPVVGEFLIFYRE